MDFIKKFLPVTGDLQLGTEQVILGIWNFYPEAVYKNQPVSVFVFNESTVLLPLARNFLKRLKTVKHPNILSYIKDDDEPDAKSFKIITERANVLTPESINVISKNAMWRDWFSSGLHKVVEFFMEARLIHGNLLTQGAVLVATDGGSRLCGFEVAGSREEALELLDLAQKYCSWFHQSSDREALQRLLSKFSFTVSKSPSKLEELSNELMTLPTKTLSDRQVFFRNVNAEMDGYPEPFVNFKLIPAVMMFFVPPLCPELVNLLISSRNQKVIQTLIECPDKFVRKMLLDRMEQVNHLVGEKGISQLMGSMSDTYPEIRDAALKASALFIPKMSAKLGQEAFRSYIRLVTSDDQPIIRKNALTCLSKLSEGLISHDALSKALAKCLADSYTPCRKMSLTVIKTFQKLFSQEDVCLRLIPSLSPLILDREDMDIPVQALHLIRLFISRQTKEPDSGTLSSTSSPANSVCGANTDPKVLTTKPKMMASTRSESTIKTGNAIDTGNIKLNADLNERSEEEKMLPKVNKLRLGMRKMNIDSA